MKGFDISDILFYALAFLASVIVLFMFIDLWQTQEKSSSLIQSCNVSDGCAYYKCLARNQEIINIANKYELQYQSCLLEKE